MISYIHRKEIDITRWDDVIANSPAETIYPYSWYLDAAAPNWSALIMNDYQYIMPVIWTKKFGIRYTLHPNFVQQLGVFSREIVDPLIVKMFLKQVYPKFRFGNLRFNSKNLIGEEHHFEVRDMVNYELPLKEDYHVLYTNYTIYHRRNIDRAREKGVVFREDISLDELMAFKKEHEVVHRSDSYYDWMADLYASLIKRDVGRAFGIYIDGKLEAAAFFGYSRKRIIYLLSVSSPAGKESRAMFMLLDNIIQMNSGSDLIFDFEGSIIKSIARFFNGFGAKPIIYQGISFQRFPAGLYKLKKDAGKN